MEPPKIEIKLEQDGYKQLIKELGDFQHHLPRHLRAVVNKVAARIRVQVAKELGKVMRLKSNYDADFKKAQTLKKVIKAKQMADLKTATATLQLSPGYRFPLKYYDARPMVRKRKGKKVYFGVIARYQPARTGNQRTVFSDAFIMQPWGNNVYRRSGGNRRPIEKVTGPKPGDYYDQIGAVGIAKKIATERLPYEIKRRVRELILQRNGVLKLRASRTTKGAN